MHAASLNVEHKANSINEKCSSCLIDWRHESTGIEMRIDWWNALGAWLTCLTSDFMKFPLLSNIFWNCVILHKVYSIIFCDYTVGCASNPSKDELKKCNYVLRHQFAIFHHIRELFQPQHHQMHRDYENINTRALPLKRSMHNVLEMIYWFHFNVSTAINNAQNDGWAIKLVAASSKIRNDEKEAKR